MGEPTSGGSKKPHVIVRGVAAAPAKRELFEPKPTCKLDRDEVLALLAQGRRRDKKPTDLEAMIEVVKDDAIVPSRPAIANGTVRFANTVRKTPVSGVSVVAPVLDPPAPIIEPRASAAEPAVVEPAVDAAAVDAAAVAVDAAAVASAPPVPEPTEIAAPMVVAPDAPADVEAPAVVEPRPDRRRDLAIGIAIGVSALAGIWIALSL